MPTQTQTKQKPKPAGLGMCLSWCQRSIEEAIPSHFLWQSLAKQAKRSGLQLVASEDGLQHRWGALEEGMHVLMSKGLGFGV